MSDPGQGPGPAGGPGESGDAGRAADGGGRSEVLAHLQEAALQLIGAARATLDAAEAAVRDPEALGSLSPLVEMAGDLFRAMAERGAAAWPGQPGGRPSGGPEGGGRPPSDGVERIRVS